MDLRLSSAVYDRRGQRDVSGTSVEVVDEDKGLVHFFLQCIDDLLFFLVDAVAIDVYQFSSHADIVERLHGIEKLVEARHLKFNGLLGHEFILHEDKQISVGILHKIG